MKNKSFSRRLSFVVILSMLASCFCLPGIAFGVDKTSPFTDLSEKHWAFKSVIKLQCRGVISGYSNNLYKPDNVISEVEAVILAVRNQAKSSEVAKEDDSRELPFEVPEWAKSNNKKELLFAMDQGLIELTGSNAFVATKAATRAWFTELMIRMCNMSDEVAALNLTPTEFKDNDDISPESLGYINVAVAKGLISGYSDNTFMPDKYVTRVEAASMLDRCEPFLNLSSTVRLGTIKGAMGSMMTIQTANNEQNVLFADTTWIFDENGAMIDSADLKTGENLKFIMGNTNVLFAQRTTEAVVINIPVITPSTSVTEPTPEKTDKEPEPVKEETPKANAGVKGTVMYVSEADSLLVMRKADGSILTCSIAKNADIKDINGVNVYLDALPSGSEIEVTANSEGNIDTIVLNNSTANGTTTKTGIVYQIVPDQKLIMLKGVGNEVSSYQYTSLVDVSMSNRDNASINDISAGDEVKLTVESGIVSKIVIVSVSKTNYISGTIELMPENSDMIIVKVDGENKIFNLSEKLSVIIPGNSVASRTSLKIGDAIRLYVNEGEVNKIEVQNRLVGNELEGTVSAIDTREDILVLATSSGVTYSYTLRDNVRILIDSSEGKLSDIEVGDTVSITLYNDEISTITAVSGMTGKVTKVDTDRMLLTLTNTITGDERTYAVASNPDVVAEGVNKASLSNVRKGDIIRIEVEDEIIESIEVQRTLPYTVTAVNNSSSRLNVITDSGTTRTLYLKSSVELEIPGISYPSIYDFKAGDQINVTYLGTSLKKVEVVPSTVGVVTEVNEKKGTFSVKTYSGTTKKYEMTEDSIIYLENANIGSKYENESVDVLKENDRVLVLDNDDDLTVYRLDKVTGTYVTVLTDTDQIRMIQTPTIVTRTYSVSNDIYLHQGDNMIGWGSFYVNENIAVYIHEGQVFEVEVVE